MDRWERNTTAEELIGTTTRRTSVRPRNSIIILAPLGVDVLVVRVCVSVRIVHSFGVGPSLI